MDSATAECAGERDLSAQLVAAASVSSSPPADRGAVQSVADGGPAERQCTPLHSLIGSATVTVMLRMLMLQPADRSTGRADRASESQWSSRRTLTVHQRRQR